MSNAAEHRVGAGLAIGAISALNAKDGRDSALPLADATIAALLARLPDILEPAHHPNHRQFFHSMTFAGCIGYGMYKAYEWQPKNELKKFLRRLLLIGGSAYLVHLIMDGCTPKGLPLI